MATGNGRSSRDPVRYAVVGRAYIAQVAIHPAFASARNSRLVALVFDDREKLETLPRRYDVGITCDYEAFDELLESGEIDAAFIALPNHMHADFTERCARAGVHVLCEKPMAVTSRECERMVAAVEANGVELMIAYRLHFDVANLRAVEIAQSGEPGELRIFDSLFTMQVTGERNIRTTRSAGGGPLSDIGIYCVNAARYLFQDEPYEVFAWHGTEETPRFREVPEMTSASMRFPHERFASFTASFGAADVARRTAPSVPNQKFADLFRGDPRPRLRCGSSET